MPTEDVKVMTQDDLDALWAKLKGWFVKGLSGATDGAAVAFDGTSGKLIKPLGYTPFNNANFTKANIKSTLGISDWALAASKPSYTHNEIGAGNLTIGDGANSIFLRTTDAWASAIYHQTNADEAVVFLNKHVDSSTNYTTSWIFAYGNPYDRPDWVSLTPALQIKGQCVAINKLIGSRVGGAYNLDVNGTLNATTIYQNGTALATVATSGSYNDLSDKPTIPTVNNGNLYLQASGTTKVTFTANQSGNSTFNIATGSTNGTLSIGGTDVAVKGLGASAYVGYDTTVTKDSAKLITSGAVWTAIDNLPEPMVFRGSLGTGGTITALPVNGSASIGDTYKVITAGTYASKAAKVGDTFICLTKTSSANTWELIPSGDEPSGTVTSVGLSMPTGFSVSSSPVTSSGTLTVAFASGYSLPTTAKQGNWDDAYDKRHTHSSLTLSTTAQAYDGTHTLALPASDPYTSARTPSSHASSGTGYGVGTTSNYGHVKLATGDMNGASGADGVACGKNHTHSQYGLASDITTLQGYFTNGVANNADKVDGYHASELYVRGEHRYGLENYIYDVVAGGQTTRVNDDTITTSGTASDTYFYIKTTENLVPDEIYTFGFYVEGYTGTGTWVFRCSNSQYCATVSINKNGWVWGTGTAIPSGGTATSQLLIDDVNSGNARALTFSKFIMVKGYALPAYVKAMRKQTIGYASALTNATVLDTSAKLDAFHEAYTLKYAVWNGFNTSVLNSNGLVIDGGYTSTNYGFQILIDDDPTYIMALRQKSTGGWSAWKRIPMGDGTGASGTWGISVSGDANGVRNYNGSRQTADNIKNLNDGALHYFLEGDGWRIIHTSWDNGGYDTQIAIPDHTLDNKSIKWRSLGAASSHDTYEDWKNILDSSNYTDYTVKKDGTGATGSWGINVTGSAGSVAWSNVSSRPTKLSQFTDDLGTSPTHTHSQYVLLDAGADEQTIKSSISSLSKGVINLWRNSGDHYTFLGFSNGTTETYLGGIGFKSQSDHNLYRKDSSNYYKIWDENNDGANSGLDADLLDGQHGSYYQPKVSALGSSTQPVYISAAGTFSTCDLSTTYAPYNANGYLPLNGGRLKGRLEATTPEAGASTISHAIDAIVIGPKSTRPTTAGSYYAGLAFNHMLNCNNTTTYDTTAQGWIGLRLYDIPGSERSYLVFATKNATSNPTDRPVERMCISPAGYVGIGVTAPENPLEVSGNVKATTFNSLTLTAATTGFTIAGGITSKTLTVNETYTLGSACSHAHGDYVTSVGIDATNGKLTWAKGGTAETAPDIVAAKLTTVSKTAWGRTYWTSSGVPDSISGDMSNVGNIAFSASGKNIGGTMYFDTTNHRIGINDSTPSCAFDVTGDVQASGGIAAGGILNLAYNGAGTQGTLTQIQINGRALTDTSGIVNIPLANTTSTGDGAMSHSDKLKLDGIATGATNVTTDTVAGWGYIKDAAGIANALGYIAARENKKSRLVTGTEYRFQSGDNDCINIWIVSEANVNLYLPYDWDYQTPLRLIIANAYSGTVTVKYKATSGTQKIYSQSDTISLSVGRAALVEMIQFYNASVGGELTFITSTSYLQRSIT